MIVHMKFWFRLAVLSSCVIGAWAQPAAPKAEVPPEQSALDAVLFYQILLGELNTRQGSPGSGFSIMLDAARKTRDPALFQRAVDMALRGVRRVGSVGAVHGHRDIPLRAAEPQRHAAGWAGRISR